MCDIHLTDDVWLSILAYLNFKDLISCSKVNSSLNSICSHNSLWRTLCKKYWLDEECPENLSWKQHFINWYADYGRYIHCYRKVKTVWNKFYKFLEANCPDIRHSVNNGASESELDDAEQKLKYKLPLDLRCAYRIHNGQTFESFGLLGSVTLSTYYRTETLLDVSMACHYVQNGRGVEGCMPLTVCPYSGFSEYISLTDQYGLSLNHIYCRSRDDVSNFTSGRDIPFFISGKNFLSWFTNYVDTLISGGFSLDNGEIFRYYHPPDCVERTGPFQVSVSTCFLPDVSRINPPYYLHTYMITMQMDPNGSDSDSCQLKSRHWIITDENGYERRVDGHGVAGEYPIMRPGASHTWVSCTTFKTTYGNMKGHFKMRNLQTGMLTEIACPTFHMKCLPYVNVFEDFMTPR